MSVSKVEIQNQALQNATNNESMANYPAIFEGFMAKGIPADQIKPRENVFTYNAWQALERQVRKGEKGVKVVTLVKGKDKETGKPFSFQKMTTVFHISQTDRKDGQPDDLEPVEAAQEVPAAPAAVEAETPADPTATNARYDVGTVFDVMWGYEQTNYNFYQVVAKKGKTMLVVREIKAHQDYDGEAMAGLCWPMVDAFKDEKTFNVRVAKDGYLKIDGRYASPTKFDEVNGKKVYQKLRFTTYG